MKDNNHLPFDARQQGQAIIEYALLLVLVGLAFGLAIAALQGPLQNVWITARNDVLRQEEVTYIPDRDEFWQTVTAEFENEPKRRQNVPTNTPLPPTVVPTDGPTADPHAPPTATPQTPTPTLTPTQKDIISNAPLYDSINNPEWWRADYNVPMPGSPWEVSYYNNRTLSGTAVNKKTGVIDINYTFAPGTAPASGLSSGENFSMRLERGIRLAQPVTVIFNVVADDGMRIYVNGTEVSLRSAGGVVGAWRDQPATAYTGTVALAATDPADPEDMHDIRVEYYNAGGEGRLLVKMSGGSANPDDTAVTAGGDPTAGGFVCNWGRPEGPDAVTNSNTESYMWEEYMGGDQPNNARCYLEWRGAVRIRHGELPNPQLVFWDVWDFQGGVDGWLEVAEYIPVEVGKNPPVADRDSMTWQKVNVRQKGTSNYNWTRNAVFLSNYFDFTDPEGETLVTFRFVFQTPGASSVRRWYVDDVEVRSAGIKTFTLNKEWNLDDAAQTRDFYASGGKAKDGTISGWGLVSNNKYGPSGMAWHESVGGGDPTDDVAVGDYTPYKRHTEQPNSNADNALRYHTLELAGWVDLVNVPVQDSRGNRGAPVLSFWHAFDLGAYTGLKVQFTTDGYGVANPNWQTFDDGELRDVTANGDARNLTFLEHMISLDRNQIAGSPTRIRVRWVMSVHRNAVRKDGWWIDQIRLGREEDPKWTDYPFYDDAQQFTYQYWRFTGEWAQTDRAGRAGIDEPPASDGYKRYSYVSTSGATYGASETTWLQLKWPIDLYNNTQDKLFVDRLQAAQNGQNSHGAPAQNPHLTFYFRRDIASGDKLVVEWKQLDGTTWTPMWEYRHGMQTTTSSLNGRTGTQLAWEYVDIDLAPVLQAVGAADTNARRKDDIMFRFVLETNSSSHGAGVFIDDVRVEERETEVFKFWPTSLNGSTIVNVNGLGNGNGVSLVEEGDVSESGRGWWDAFHRGGDWYAINYESRTGVLSFHESGLNDQNYAPRWDWNVNYNNGGCCGDVDFVDSSMHTGIDTFNVLELNTIIDMRATDSIDMPQLRFWTRYHIGLSDYLRVEVSYELPTTDANMRSRCGVGSTSSITQCYENQPGWSRWSDRGLDNRTLWNRGHSSNNSYGRSMGWTQERVDLRSFAAQIVNPSDRTKNTVGKRIRIRFVYDALDINTNFDGWYIDNVHLRYGVPGANEMTEIDKTPFDDRSSSMKNWIGEGGWGLDPNFYIGTGGGPIALGLWNVKWWQCNGNSSDENQSNPSCENIGKKYNVKDRFPGGADIFLTNPNRPAPDRTQTVSSLTYDMGGGGPVGGWSVADRLMMEATINTPLVSAGGFAPGPRSLSVLSDDGVRVKVEAYDAGGDIIPAGWLINSWVNRSATTDMASFNFENGKRYRITVQYFENTGNGTMIFTLTDGRYSFSDTPKQGSLLPDAMPIPFSDTALMLNNVLNLQGIENNEYILMEYRTRYRIEGSAQVYLEISNDGGFTWTRNGLQDAVVINGVQVIPSNTFASTSYDGYHGVNPADYGQDWRTHQNNLTMYRGQNVILRFRADFRGSKNSGPSFCARRSDCQLNNRLSEEFNAGYYDGWWLTAIRVQKFGG